MSNFFNPDNPVTRFLSLLCDLIMLNILFIITSIPLFTIGCSISSLYNVTLKIIRKENPTIIKSYFKAFKSNFKQATIIWIPSAILLLFFFAEIRIIYTVIDPKYTNLQIPVLVMIYALVSVLVYAFPMLSLYNNTTKQILKNSLLLSIGNFPTTIFVAVIYFGLYKITDISSKALVTEFSIFLFCGFAVLAYFISIYLDRIFTKCEMGPSDETAVEDNESEDTEMIAGEKNTVITDDSAVDNNTEANDTSSESSEQ